MTAAEGENGEVPLAVLQERSQDYLMCALAGWTARLFEWMRGSGLDGTDPQFDL